MAGKIAALMLMVACAALVSAETTPAPAQGPSASPPAQPTTPPPGLPSAWIAFEHAWEHIAGYSATVIVFEQKGTEVQNVVFDYTFRKPSSATVHVVEGPNAGATLVWDGGDTVVAHRGTGLMALFKKRYSLHDPVVTTIRGSSLDQLSYAAFLAHAQDMPGKITRGPRRVIDGIPTEAVTLVPSSVANTGLTLETVFISTTTNLPMRVVAYDGPTKVRQVDFSNVKLAL